MTAVLPECVCQYRYLLTLVWEKLILYQLERWTLVCINQLRAMGELQAIHACQSVTRVNINKIWDPLTMVTILF